MHYLEATRGWLATWMTKGVEKYSVEIPFLPKSMLQFQYCLSIDPDHDKGESNLRWIVMQQMYKLKTDVQNNHWIGLVGIMQVGGGQKKLIGSLSGFAKNGTVWERKGMSISKLRVPSKLDLSRLVG